jgi:hypothetical protein
MRAGQDANGRSHDRPAEGVVPWQVRQAGGVTVQVNSRGAVMWCDDWSELLRLALRGHPNVKLRPRGEVVWID